MKNRSICDSTAWSTIDSLHGHVRSCFVSQAMSVDAGTRPVLDTSSCTLREDKRDTAFWKRAEEGQANQTGQAKVHVYRLPFGQE